LQLENFFEVLCQQGFQRNYLSKKNAPNFLISCEFSFGKRSQSKLKAGLAVFLQHRFLGIIVS